MWNAFSYQCEKKLRNKFNLRFAEHNLRSQCSSFGPIEEVDESEIRDCSEGGKIEEKTQFGDKPRGLSVDVARSIKPEEFKNGFVTDQITNFNK